MKSGCSPFSIALPCILLVVSTHFALAQTAPDDHPYGSASIRDSIQMAMLAGDSALVWQKIRSGYRLRGKQLGTPSQEPVYRKPDSTSIQPTELEMAWDRASTHLAAWHQECPELSTDAPAGMLGAYFAETGRKNKIPLEHLGDIGQMLEDQQFTYIRCGEIKGTEEGVFGYVSLPNHEPCAHSGTVQRTTLTMCREIPTNCPVYRMGDFKDLKFVVADQSADLNHWDGGMAYHQGWAVEEMVQGYILQKDNTLRTKFLEAALLAGKWCRSEQPVVQHQYTAKNIWALAALYDLTGDKKWKGGLLRLLKINLLPGVLLDRDQDGQVDGAEPLRFDSLGPVSTVQGRMWDGQNSSAWNTAICAWAMVNSYAALRDRGDQAEAASLKPYYEAMLENLAAEIITFGTIPAGAGYRDLTYAFLEALIKIDKAEGSRHAKWETAATILWNGQVVQTGNLFAVNLGQYLLWKSGWKYQPRFQLK